MKKLKTKPKPKAKAAPPANLLSPDAIVRWPLERFIPYVRNPRKNDDAVDRMAASIREFGFKIPILARSSGDIVDGHLRLKAAQKLELAEVPVLLCDEWSEAQVKAFRLLVNRSVAWADWDDELLSLEMADLSAFEYDLSLTGFDQEETSRLLSQTHVFGSEEEEETPEPPVQPVSVLGDLWVLGEHRVLCGDSTRSDCVERLVDGKKAGLMNTDPPYGVGYANNDRPNPGVAKPRVANDEFKDEELQSFLESSFALASSVALKPDAAWYLWHAHLTQGFFAAAAAAAHVILHRQIIWVKPGLLLGRGHYHWKHEPCFMGWVEGHQPPDYGRGNGERDQTTVWEISGVGQAERKEFNHSTPKPVGLFEIPIVKHLKKGEICFEPFAGSGPQVIAAEKYGVRCFALEIAPSYVDVIVQRWQKQTGKQATLEGDGRTFDELKTERLTA